MNEGPGFAKKRYLALRDKREPYLYRARMCAQYTQPSLMPPEGFSIYDKLATPYQSLGAQGVKTLSSKLTLIEMPPNQAPFKLDVDDYTANQQLARENARAEVDEEFSRIERAFVTDIEASPMRQALGEVNRQLLVSGTVAMFQNSDGSAIVWRLDQFVVHRTPSGRLKELVVEEEVDVDALSEQQRLATSCAKADGDDGDHSTVTMYTHFRVDLPRQMLTARQEVNGFFLPNSERAWPIDRAPLIVASMERLPRESYGRSYVESLLGDLVSYEGLSKFILEGASQMAKTLWLRNPNGVTRAKDLEKPNGSIINGNPNDVTALRADKSGDFAVAFQQAGVLQRRLEQAFLMHTSVQRPAERVTAEEIRFVAQELEDALGGTYAILAQELQLPMVKFQLDRMTRQKRIPSLPRDVVNPRITTGLAALGRGHDLAKIKGFVADVANMGGPEVHQEYLVMSDLLSRLGAGHGIDTAGLVRSETEVAQAQAARQQNTLMNDVTTGSAPGAIQELVKGVVKSQAQ